MTDAGLMLGRETIFVHSAHGATGAAGVSVNRGEARVPVLLAAAYGRPIADHAIAKMRRAAELWHEGEEALAQSHLAFIGVPDVDEVVAFRLSLAAKLFQLDVSPDTLVKALGFDRAVLALEKYNRVQPRVPAGSGRESGQWTSGHSGPGSDKKGSIQLAGIADDLAEAIARQRPDVAARKHVLVPRPAACL